MFCSSGPPKYPRHTEEQFDFDFDFDFGREGGRVRIGPCGGAPVLVMEDPTTWCHGSDPGLPSHRVPSLVGSPRLKRGSQK